MLNSTDLNAGTAAPALQVNSVLVVEDEGLLSIMLEDQLRELGVSEVHLSGDIEHAAQLAREVDVDCAVLDLYVRETPTHLVADILSARGIPFLFCTGGTIEDVAEHHRDRPILAKPYGDDQLRACIAQALQFPRQL